MLSFVAEYGNICSYLMVFDACRGRVLLFSHDGGNENCSGLLFIVVTLSFGPYGGTVAECGQVSQGGDFTFNDVFVGDQFFLFNHK